MKHTYKKISELTDTQKSHLAWRLERHTYIGMITACAIARGEHGDLPVNEVFAKADMTPHQSKIHARKVMRFKV